MLLVGPRGPVGSTYPRASFLTLQTFGVSPSSGIAECPCGYSWGPLPDVEGPWLERTWTVRSSEFGIAEWLFSSHLMVG